MGFDILTGEKLNIDKHLQQIMDIDAIVYGGIDSGFVGKIENLRARYLKNKDSFVCLAENDNIVGYINYFPVCDKLFHQLIGPVRFGIDMSKDDLEEYKEDSDGKFFYELLEDEGKKKKEEKYFVELPGFDDEDGYFTEYSEFEKVREYFLEKIGEDALDESHEGIDPKDSKALKEAEKAYIRQFYNTSRDDDITPDEILGEYSTEEGKNNLFIISVAIHPDKRRDPDGRPSILVLRDAFIAHLNELNEKYGINSIFGMCISDDGVRTLSGMNFNFHRNIKVDDPEATYFEKVYLCYGDYLRRLLEHKTYHKTYRDDIYLFVPFADNPENPKLDEVFQKKGAFHYDGDDMPEETRELLENLDYYMEYEYEGFIKSELERIYLGQCIFRHTTDRYMDETVGEQNAGLLLLAYKNAHMYVLVIYLPGCRFSSSMVGDQLSQRELDIRFGEDDEIDEYGFVSYKNVIKYMGDKYGLVRCGNGKAFYCMSDKPETKQEFRNILTGETFFSVHQDFFIKNYDLVSQQLKTDLAIYDYYEAYMSPVSLAIILKTFDDNDGKQRIEDAATYVFIVELVLLQNTALNKLSKKVGKALEHEGDVSYDYINSLYKDYGKTLKLWDARNFKYYGTQMEAEQIRKAFENDELRERYQEEQGFLENMVEVNAANDERKSGWIIGIVGTLLALFQVKDYMIEMIAGFYSWIGNVIGSPESIIVGGNEAVEETSQFSNLFSVVVWGSVLIFVMGYIAYKNQKRYEQKKKLSGR